MTVLELREILSRYDDDCEVYLRIDDIVDNYGFLIAGNAEAKQVIDGVGNDIIILGTE